MIRARAEAGANSSTAVWTRTRTIKVYFPLA